MKSIIISYTLVIASFMAFLSGSWFVQFDHTQNTLQMATKRALMSTMVDYVDLVDYTIEDVANTFTLYFQELALADYDYEISITGFLAEPLFIRVECIATSPKHLRNQRIRIDESMIEELREDE